MTPPPENAVELHLRSLTDVLVGPIPRSSLDRVEGFWLRLRRPADLSALRGLRHLDRLAVEGPYDLDLRHLPASLRSLHVEAPVRDVAAVAALPRLETLYLGYTRVTELGPLRHLFNVVVHHGPPVISNPAVAPSTDPLAEYRATDDRGRRAELSAQLVGTGDPEAVQELIPDGRIVGLLLDDRVVVPFPPNVWGVTGGLTGALAHIWRGIGGSAPWFVAAVHARTVGLALLDNGSLAYLTWIRDQDREAPVRQAWQIDHGPDPYPRIRVVIGTPPVPARVGPAPLREFWGVHGSLGRIGGELSTTIRDHFPSWSADEVRRHIGGRDPDRFRLSFGGDDFSTAVLDLALLDPAGDPTIATWSVKEREIGSQQQFWDWLDGEGTRLVFL